MSGVGLAWWERLVPLAGVALLIAVGVVCDAIGRRRERRERLFGPVKLTAAQREVVDRLLAEQDVWEPVEQLTAYEAELLARRSHAYGRIEQLAWEELRASVEGTPLFTERRGDTGAR